MLMKIIAATFHIPSIFYSIDNKVITYNEFTRFKVTGIRDHSFSEFLLGIIAI